MIYFFPFIALVVFSMTDLFRKDSSLIVVTRVGMFYLIGVLAFFIGARGSAVGRDYDNYMDWFYRVSENSNLIISELKDPGFLYLFLGVDSVGLGVYGFLIFVAFVSLFLKFLFSIRVLAADYGYLIFLIIISRFLFSHEFAQMRSGLAIPLASIALVAFYCNNRFSAILGYALALSFHMSVLVLAPFFLLVMLRCAVWRKESLLILLVIAFFFFGLGDLVRNVLLGIERAAPYLSGEYETSSVNLFTFYFLLRLLLIITVVSFFYEIISCREKFIFLLVASGVFIQAALSWSDAFSLRLSEVFGLFDAAALVIPIRYLKGLTNKLCYYFLLIVFSFIMFWSSMRLVGSYEVSSAFWLA